MRRLAEASAPSRASMKGANDHYAGHLTVRACGWLQVKSGQARDFREVFLQFVDHLQRALRVVVLQSADEGSRTRQCARLSR